MLRDGVGLVRYGQNKEDEGRVFQEKGLIRVRFVVGLEWYG